MSHEFSNINSINNNAREDSAEEELNPVEKERKLSEYCKKIGNEIEIWESGSAITVEPVLGSLAEKLDQEEADVLAMILKQANSFLHSPVFSDSFHKDHGARRAWEQSHNFQVMPEALKHYYQNNRFNLNLLGLPFTALEFLESLEEVDALSHEELMAVSEIRENLTQASPDRLHEYGNLSDQEKYQQIVKLKKVFADIVVLLSKK